jgi:hypothetical protein
MFHPSITTEYQHIIVSNLIQYLLPLGAAFAPCLPVFPKLAAFAANPRPPFYLIYKKRIRSPTSSD